jgi:hypothetical protein
VTTSHEEHCFVVEDHDGQSFELEFLPSDSQAREHFQSVWQRLAKCVDWYYKKEQPPAPEWAAWKPWQWCDDKREAYAPRQKYVAWCGSNLAGILNVWPGFPSMHEAGRQTLYLEHLAASPGNLKTEVWDRRYTGVGQALLAYAVKLSLELGMEGRLSLHAANGGAVSFYQHLNRKLGGGLFHPEQTGVAGPTPHGEGDRPKLYLETTQTGALQLLEVYRA